MIGRDELRRPLRRRSLFERIWAARPSAFHTVSALAILGFAAGATAIVRLPDPHTGEPVIIADIPPPEPLLTASIEKPAASPEADGAPEPEMPEAEVAAEEPIPDTGSEPVVEVQDQQVVDTGPAIIISSRKSLAPAPIASVTEEGPYGPLPKIGRNNKKPSSVYARSVSAGIMMSDAPKIAIVLGGMGLNEDLTRSAIKVLPGDVSLAFAPYGENLQALVNRARAGGHEIVLQVPMEPVGYPQINPGPKTLATSADKTANLDALMWHMGRFSGYSAVMNYMGGRFLADPQSARPVLSEIKKRGLIFVGDGTTENTMIGGVAESAGLSLREAQVVIDANPTPEAIGQKLIELEERARRDGFAIGTGSGLGVTIDTVAEWAKQLNDRGIILVPVTAAFKSRV